MGAQPRGTVARAGAVAGAAFLMATSAIGPGFLTQTTVFTERLGAAFAFAILVSVLVDLAVQVNVWRVLGVSRRRGDELAAAILPGLGPLLAVLVVLGGLAFNVGNLAGCGLGLHVLGLNEGLGAVLSALLAIGLLAAPRAGQAMDVFAKALGGVMIVLTAGIMCAVGPDYLEALRSAFRPARVELLPILTIVGGTVGGYISFSGVHRLLDAGVGGEADRPALTRAAAAGIIVTAVMRVLLFLAVLGVVGHGGRLDPANPAASAFRLGAGERGHALFGVILWSAAITSVVGCTYTSLTFLRGLRVWNPAGPGAPAAFIALSLTLLLWAGQPVRLLILAGGLNGLILPLTLAVVLLGARRPALVGGYRHPWPLSLVGWMAFAVSLGTGLLALGDLKRLFSG